MGQLVGHECLSFISHGLQDKRVLFFWLITAVYANKAACIIAPTDCKNFNGHGAFSHTMEPQSLRVAESDRALREVQ